MIYVSTTIAFSILAFFELLYKTTLGRNIRYLRFEYLTLGLSFLYLALFASFRTVGYDYEQYDLFYKNLSVSNYFDYTVEIGYAAINQFARYLNTGYHGFLFALALVTIGLKFRFFHQYSPIIFFSVLVYFPITFMISDMGQIRNGLAMSVVLFGYSYLFKRDYLKFTLFTFIAFLFHSSAIIVFLSIFFVRYKYALNAKFVISSLILCSIFLFYNVANIIQFLPGIFGFSQLSAKITLYTTNQEFMKTVGLSATTFLRLAILGLMFLYRKSGQKISVFYDDILKLYFFGVLIFMLFSSIGEFAFRFSNYFKVLECVILPLLIVAAKDIYSKILLIFLCVLFSYYSLYKLLSDEELNFFFLPYKNVILSSF